jgi:hypothetical protein
MITAATLWSPLAANAQAQSGTPRVELGVQLAVLDAVSSVLCPAAHPLPSRITFNSISAPAFVSEWCETDRELTE